MQKDILINSYLDKILEANKITNLTRINSLEEAYLLHVEDSLIGLEEVEKAPEGLYADLGSGGGFPGVPLAIMTGRSTVLVDSVKKKMVIVENILKELSLQDSISTYGGRIEDFSLEHPRAFSVVTARALSKLSILMELSSPLLKTGGLLICYKANIQEDEWNHALELQKKLGFSLLSDRSLCLSDKETLRRIVCFKKVGKAQIKLPRPIGHAQKKPL